MCSTVRGTSVPFIVAWFANQWYIRPVLMFAVRTVACSVLMFAVMLYLHVLCLCLPSCETPQLVTLMCRWLLRGSPTTVHTSVLMLLSCCILYVNSFTNVPFIVAWLPMRVHMFCADVCRYATTGS